MQQPVPLPDTVPSSTAPPTPVPLGFPTRKVDKASVLKNTFF